LAGGYLDVHAHAVAGEWAAMSVMGPFMPWLFSSFLAGTALFLHRRMPAVLKMQSVAPPSALLARAA